MGEIKKVEYPFNLLQLLDKEHNSVISPYGIATVLAMAAEGASDECLKEILSVFGFENLEELREKVLAVQADKGEAFVSDNSLKVKQGENRIELLDAFRKVIGDRYDASITEESSAGESAFELKNVANFNAKWFYKMRRDDSREIMFRNADGSSSYPAFLKSKNEYRYYDSAQDFYSKEDVEAVAIPYKLNEERIPYDLVIVKSKKELTGEMLQHILDNMELGECEIELPEFNIKNEHKLIPMMAQLGLRKIFNKYVEAFDKIATKPLYANMFEQNAEIKVDESGTVAKAVTLLGMSFTTCLTAPVPNLCFNSPFQYFLRNTNTGDIIFMGKINDFDDGREVQDTSFF